MTSAILIQRPKYHHPRSRKALYFLASFYGIASETYRYFMKLRDATTGVARVFGSDPISNILGIRKLIKLEKREMMAFSEKGGEEHTGATLVIRL